MKHHYLVLSLFLFSSCLFAQQTNFQISLTEAQSLKAQGKLPEAVFALRQAVQQIRTMPKLISSLPLTWASCPDSRPTRAISRAR